jgi:hypothetical protein
MAVWPVGGKFPEKLSKIEQRGKVRLVYHSWAQRIFTENAYAETSISGDEEGKEI